MEWYSSKDEPRTQGETNAMYIGHGIIAVLALVAVVLIFAFRQCA